jgi:CHAT domain-containing protein
MCITRKISFLFLFFIWVINVWAVNHNQRQGDSISASNFHKAGIKALEDGDFEKALVNFKNVYQIRERIYGNLSNKLAPPLINIGIAYKNLGNIDRAIEFYKKVENLCSKDELTNIQVLAISYANLSVAFKTIGDYNQALLYQKNAYRILKNDSVKFSRNFQDSKYNIADIQLKMGLNKEVIVFSKANLKNVRLELKPRLFDLIALAYFNLGKFDLSETNYLNSINSWIQLKGDNHIELISEYIAYSTFLLSLKKYKDAFLYINKASEIIQLKKIEEKSTTNSDVLASFGDYYYLLNSEAGQIDDFRRKQKENLNTAIQYYQKSIIALVDSFQVTDPLKNPSLKNNIISDIQLVDVINKKARALEKLAEIFHSEFNNKDAEKYYAASLNALSVVMELIHRLQIGFENEDSKLFLSQNQQSTFFEAISISHKLFLLTKDQKYVRDAFVFSEKSKSSNLLASIKDVKAKEFGGIPDSLLKKESVLKNSINTYNSKLFEESNSAKPDTQKVNLYSSKIFKYNEEYSRLIESFEKSYPQYYALKYENKVIGAEQVQSKLNKRQALIEYYLKEPENISSTGELYIFTVTSDSISFTKEAIDQEFVHRIQTLHDFLISPNYLDTKRKDYVSYSLAAYGLYKKLLMPVARKLEGKSLTIIPHDKLSYIPFDALLSEMPDTAQMNFRDLKYVIRDYSINYGYSATLLYDSSPPRKTFKKLLIFSPEYNPQVPRKDLETGNSYYLSSLPGANAEIKAISNVVSSVSFVGKNAQESEFKKNANNFDILHLAMHTIINDSLPMLSKLVFSNPEISSSDDGYLNAYEVYNMKLNARLAVLSACETGSGKLQGGEGVMSMARGFIYAGCPSVVMTLWQVEDKSGVKIMSDFYRYLSKGKRKDVALRMAKLNHLENSDPLTAHPHFWLGYVSIGNADALYTSKDVYFVAFLFIALLLLFADYHFRRKRTK